MLRPNTAALTALLAALTGIGPLSVDMYLASLPDIGRRLAASEAEVQLSLSFYLVGFAVGQVIYGPISDRYGRRPILLAALAVFTASSAVCAAAPSIGMLNAARFCQALGGAGGVVLARAVARDLYEGTAVARELSRMAAVMALAPLVAPLIGGALQTYFGWRANFVVLAAFGAAAATLVWLMLPESLRRQGEAASIASNLRAFPTFLADRIFLAHAAILVCAFGGLFAWISGAAFVLQDLYGLTPMEFGVAFAVGSAGYLVGTWVAMRQVARLGLDRTIGWGALLLAGGGAASLLAPALGLSAAAAVLLVAAIAIFLAGLGLALPQAQAGALMPFPERAGTASSLVGALQQTSGAVVGAIVGHLLGQSAWPLAAAVAIMGSLALVIWALTRSTRAAGVASPH
ncbi:MAG TPA: multidrug effflux MFS transporter [Xanthobacteraceae bacterium]|nr:multidrug effflux MFS transporter [Xanthobacteraceae bacterium]